MNIEDLARDVERLKAENRRLRKWGGLVLLLGLALGATAMAREERVPDVVRAMGFELLNGNGESVAVLGMERDGGPPVFGREGDPRKDTFASFRIFDPTSRVWTAVSPFGVRVDERLAKGKEPHPFGLVSGFFIQRGADEGGAAMFGAKGHCEFHLTGKDGKTLFKVPE